jgi:hypothetical protein
MPPTDGFAVLALCRQAKVDEEPRKSSTNPGSPSVGMSFVPYASVHLRRRHWSRPLTVPLRNFVSCVTCGRRLTGSWSKGRSSYYAYYHCRPGCSAVHLTKARLESLFTDELARLQPSPGYMRLLKESVLQVWKARRAAAQADLANAERQASGNSEEARSA